MARLQQAETILGLVADVRVKLDSTLVGWARGNLDDIQAQLAARVPPGFLRDVPESVLAEYPRYLKAMATRPQRATHAYSHHQYPPLKLQHFTHQSASIALAGKTDRRPDS